MGFAKILGWLADVKESDDRRSPTDRENGILFALYIAAIPIKN